MRAIFSYINLFFLPVLIACFLSVPAISPRGIDHSRFDIPNNKFKYGNQDLQGITFISNKKHNIIKDDISNEQFKKNTQRAGMSINGTIEVNPLRIYDNDVAGGEAGIDRVVTIKNTGADVLTVASIGIEGANPTEFVSSGLPVFPKDINPGNSISFSVAFNPSSVGLQTALININSNDVVNPVIAVSLRGLGTSGLGGANEPSLQAILNLLEFQVITGDDNAATTVINSDATLQKAPSLGEEVSIQQFKKASGGPVTITPLAVFGPTGNSTIVGLGWYKSGNTSSKSELFSVSNTPLSNGQTVNVNYTGTVSFDPVSDTFGFYSRWPFFSDRHLYSEDNLNTFAGSVPHHVRVYTYRKDGLIIPDSYLVTFEENTSGFDYQDIIFVVNNVKPAPPSTTLTIPALADAYIHDGSTSNTNYGSETSLIVRGSSTIGSSWFSYLKFSLNSSIAVNKIKSAKLRLYGRNTESTASIALSLFGLDDDSWTENGINFNNAPPSLISKLSSVYVNDQAKYYEFDVTDFVKFQIEGDKVAGFSIKDISHTSKSVSFNSKENAQNPPQLIIDTATVTDSNASLFVENPDIFPSNNDFVFSRVQVPWTRDTVYNYNHDSLKVRIHNKGIYPLIIRDLTLSNDTTWKIDKINNTPYVPGSGLPVSLNSGTFMDVTLKFIAMNQSFRAKVLHETLTITSNDDKNPSKSVNLHGLWQNSGEGGHEPYAQEIINAFGFTTKTGFTPRDPDEGDSTKLKGDEIKPSYFVCADSLLPVSVRQMAAYHTCCHKPELLRWYAKDSSTTLHTFVTHLATDAQTLLPRKGLPASVASAQINPTAKQQPFGFKIGGTDWTDATKNPEYKIGVRVWKAFDANGNIIPNSYIISNDYGGTPFTNYDYNDNAYFISNIKPETGTAFFSTLGATPSAVDFDDKILQTTTDFQLNIKNLGQQYTNGTSDPALSISSINITGENRFEFSASLPANTTLNPQQSSAITVKFKPVSQGLKIADLLIYYNNSLSPLRVPLYGIGRAADAAVVINYRIKSGYSTPIIINNKTWSADNSYAFDNLEPYTNPSLRQIEGTDEDSLYFTEQSSNLNKKPFRYEIPVPNGNYYVRLHFAEVFWGVTGTGGGAGSRVMSVKLENQLRLINLDIAGEVGGAAALIKNFPVTVTDGKLNIDFSATSNRPSLSAVEVYSFASSGPLAVNKLDIKGAAIDSGIELNWISNNEKDIKYYEIQRSINNVEFTTLVIISPTNGMEYNFIDSDPYATNFYRIRQVNVDGKLLYSKIISINFSKPFAMKLFPNPVNNKIKIQFTGIHGNQKAILSIHSVSGNTMKSIPIILSNPKAEVDVSSLSSGLYIMRVISNNIIISSKFLKK
ncbi:MAG: DNRLRE domain-containing protein [Ginsengibacter sp.]